MMNVEIDPGRETIKINGVVYSAGFFGAFTDAVPDRFYRVEKTEREGERRVHMLVVTPCVCQVRT